MPTAEITRNETAERARLLRVDEYHVHLDLTRGDKVFRSTSVITFDCAEPGADSYADLVAADVLEISLNGAEIDPDTAYADDRIALAGLAARNELRVVADCAYTYDAKGMHRAVDSADGRVYLYTNFEPADARSVYANFEQPDLKASFTFRVTAPAGWVVLSNQPAADPVPAGGVADLGVRPHAAHLHLPDGGGSGGVPRGDRHAHDAGRPADTAGPGLPPVAGRVPGAGRHLDRHQAGLRLLHGAVRAGLPVRQVRPGVRPGVQRGRDGERRLRDVLRAGAVPVQGHRHDVRVAGDGDPARDGAPVVRRPGHHEVVGRPVAERVVRGVLRGPVQRGRHQVHRRLDDVLRVAQDVGLPAGPAAVDPSDRGRRADAERGDRELRRDQLREGRLRAQATRVLPGPGRFLRRHPGVLHRARLGQRHPRRPAPRARDQLGPEPGRLVEGVAGDIRAEHAAQRVHRRRGRNVHSRSRSCRRRRPSTRRCGRITSRSASTSGPGTTSCGRTGSSAPGRSADRGARADRSAAAGPDPAERRRPRLRARPVRRPVAGHADARPSASSPTRSPGRSAGARCST